MCQGRSRQRSWDEGNEVVERLSGERADEASKSCSARLREREEGLGLDAEEPFSASFWFVSVASGNWGNNRGSQASTTVTEDDD